MAKIRSLTELQALLDGETQFRKRELSLIHADFGLPMARRAGACLQYAHLEGFIKHGADAYLAYVRHQGLHQSQLTPPLASVALRSALISSDRDRVGALATLFDPTSQKAQIPNEYFAHESNLGDGNYLKILVLLGLEADSGLSSFSPFVEDLARRRHSIAHGGLETPTEVEMNESHKSVVLLLDRYSGAVASAASVSAYRR